MQIRSSSRVWNLLVGLRTTSAALGLGISSEITSFPMGPIALVLILTFLVPMFFILHLAPFLRAKRMVTGEKVCSWTEVTLRCESVEAMHKV